MAHKTKESDCMNHNLLLSTTRYIRGTTNLTLSDVFIRGDFNAATSSDPRKPWARRLLVVRCIDGDFDFSCSSDILGMDTRAKGGSEGEVLCYLKSNTFFSIFSSIPIVLTVSFGKLWLHPNSHTLWFFFLHKILSFLISCARKTSFAYYLNIINRKRELYWCIE